MRGAPAGGGLVRQVVEEFKLWGDPAGDGDGEQWGGEGKAGRGDGGGGLL